MMPIAGYGARAVLMRPLMGVACMLTRFILRCLPDGMQVIHSGIRLVGAGVLFYLATWLAEPWHGWVQFTGKFWVIYALIPLATKPEGVVVDALAQLLALQEAREKLHLWWILQWHFHGDRQAMDRVMRSVRTD